VELDEHHTNKSCAPRKSGCFPRVCLRKGCDRRYVPAANNQGYCREPANAGFPARIFNGLDACTMGVKITCVRSPAGRRQFLRAELMRFELFVSSRGQHAS
jgi:hypothetical protein